MNDDLVNCRRCPRLVEHRELVARTKRKAYREWVYWGRPVPSFGPQDARLLLVGLAPGAHGANRTGRIFTGDSSGDFLYPTLFRFGFCTQERSLAGDDGLEMTDAYITAALHCVPPGNKPTSEEIRKCRPYLVHELKVLTQVRIVVALGGIAWSAFLTSRSELGSAVPKPKPRFGHLAEVRLDSRTLLIGSYHPSRQNTQTGRLTQEMFDAVFARAREELNSDQ